MHQSCRVFWLARCAGLKGCLSCLCPPAASCPPVLHLPMQHSIGVAIGHKADLSCSRVPRHRPHVLLPPSARCTQATLLDEEGGIAAQLGRTSTAQLVSGSNVAATAAARVAPSSPIRVPLSGERLRVHSCVKCRSRVGAIAYAVFCLCVLPAMM